MEQNQYDDVVISAELSLAGVWPMQKIGSYIEVFHKQKAWLG